MPVTFAFYVAKGTLTDRMVRAATGYAESHVEMLLASGVKKANQCVSASKRDGQQVRTKSIEWNPDSWTFVTVDDHDAVDCMRRIWRHLGKPYDKIGAALTVTPFPRAIDSRWFCSELMAHGMRLEPEYHFTPGSFKDALIDMGGREYNPNLRMAKCV